MTIRTDQGSSTYCKERSLIIEMEAPRTMGREWAGPRIGTPYTGLRTEVRFRQWRSRSISSGKSKIGPAQDSRILRLSGTKTQKPAQASNVFRWDAENPPLQPIYE